MNQELEAKLRKIQTDYFQVTNSHPKFFFCPITFKDEETELCKAHIVNQAFKESSRAWTVLRKDVDVFYGANFESDFVNLQFKSKLSPSAIFSNKTMSNKFHPKFLLNNQEIDYFRSKGNLPKDISPIRFEDEDGAVLLGLNMLPEILLNSAKETWEIEIAKDLRLPALVSLIKAAHLSLFEILGYRYILSAAGIYIGREILGTFFSQNLHKPKQEVLTNALPYFHEFVNMVRPVIKTENINGTINDKKMLMCTYGHGICWALIVFVKTAQYMNAVMIPLFEPISSIGKYIDFLKNQEETITVRSCEYKNNTWLVDTRSFEMSWPKKDALLT